MTHEPREIALLTKAKTALAEAKTIDEVKDIRDKAMAIRMYAKAQGESLDIQNYAAEVKLRAERRAGELLADMEKATGSRGIGKKVGFPRSTALAPTLAEIGVKKKQSHEWQQVASVSEPEFEKHVARAVKGREELTTASVIRLAKTEKTKERKLVVAESTPSTVENLDALIASGAKFATIYADPPWKYGNQATRASTDNHYSTMTVEDIAALPIGDLAAPQSHLWLWTTNGFLRESFTLFDAWGFEFKSSYVWVKSQFGIGNYLRNAHEFLLLGTRGGLVGAAKNVRSWGEFKRTAHSAKPEEIRRQVVEKVSPGPRLELFGRRQVDGWTVWGNQIERTMFDTEVA